MTTDKKLYTLEFDLNDIAEIAGYYEITMDEAEKKIEQWDDESGMPIFQLHGMTPTPKRVKNAIINEKQFVKDLSLAFDGIQNRLQKDWDKVMEDVSKRTNNIIRKFEDRNN